MVELEASRSECLNYNLEVFRLKASYDELTEQLDVVKRENKKLADEIKDQLGDGGRSIHALNKQRHRLEVEKEEFKAALEEAEGALEQEENKVIWIKKFTNLKIHCERYFYIRLLEPIKVNI